MTNQPPNGPWDQSPWGQQPQPQYGPPHLGYPQQPYSGPPPRNGRGKAIAVAVAVIAALAVAAFAVVHFTTSGGSGHSAQNGTQTSPSGPGGGSNKNCQPVNAAYQTSAFGQSLTDAIEKHDRAAFLATASTADARAKMGLWWDNASAVGFTGGEAYADNDANSGDPEKALTSLVLDVALHNPLDVNETGQYGKGILAPMTQYKVGFAVTGAKCTISITSWTSLANTPLDVPEHLYVVHTKHTVVAGEPAMKSEINRIAPIAEKAAAWDFQFFTALKGKHDNYLIQEGFVTYVPTTSAQAEGWFRAPTAPKAKGWTADAGNVAGTNYPLPGPNSSGTPKLTGLKLGQGAAVAGARVLLNKAGRTGSSTETEATLVHEYAHDILSTNDIAAYLGGKPLAAATSEGAARWVESYFRSTPAGFSVKKSTAVPSLRPTIKANLGRFTGSVPTDNQIYGAASLGDFYYDLSASTFDYLAYKYSASFALQCVFDAYTNGGGPFSGVITSVKGGTITFANPDTYVAQWAKWVRAGLPG